MPDPLPSLLATPAVVATEVAATCALNPIGVIAAGIFVGLVVDAVLILAEQSYYIVKAYRDAVNPT